VASRCRSCMRCLHGVLFSKRMSMSVTVDNAREHIL
jgi:hypothetical protein